MPKQSRLEKWEAALIKAMIAVKQPKTNQDILAYFTRPSRSLNHRVVGEIRADKKHKGVKAATAEELEAFLSSYPVCRKHGVSSATFYKWKAKYGGLEVSEAKRLRTLEDENRRLKKLLAETMLDNAMLKDIATKKW
jgi:putative transposase